MGKILLLSPQQHFQNLYFANFEVQCFFFFFLWKLYVKSNLAYVHLNTATNKLHEEFM